MKSGKAFHMKEAAWLIWWRNVESWLDLSVGLRSALVFGVTWVQVSVMSRRDLNIGGWQFGSCIRFQELRMKYWRIHSSSCWSFLPVLTFPTGGFSSSDGAEPQSREQFVPWNSCFVCWPAGKRKAGRVVQQAGGALCWCRLALLSGSRWAAFWLASLGRLARCDFLWEVSCWFSTTEDCGILSGCACVHGRNNKISRVTLHLIDVSWAIKTKNYKGVHPENRCSGEWGCLVHFMLLSLCIFRASPWEYGLL